MHDLVQQQQQQQQPLDPFGILPASAADGVLGHLQTADLHGNLPLVCKAWHTLISLRSSTSIDANLNSIAAGHSLAARLHKNGERLAQATIHGEPLVTLDPRTAVWAALAATAKNLQELRISMPLGSSDEVALLGCIVRAAPKLQVLGLQYTPPSTPVACGTAGSAAALAAAAAQLRSLSISGAEFRSLSSIGKLTQLTHLDITAAATGLAGAVSQLLQLRHLSCISKSMGAMREGFTAQLTSSLASCSCLTSLQLVGFKASNSSTALLSGISQLQQLQQLELAGCLFQAEQLLPVAACSKLTRLSLASNDLQCSSSSNSTSADAHASSSSNNTLISLFSGLQQLVDLDVSGCRVKLQPMYVLPRLTSLHAGAHRFRFHPNQVCGQDLCGIGSLGQSLQLLDLSCNKVQASSLQQLSGLTGLTFLSLAENDLGGTSSGQRVEQTDGQGTGSSIGTSTDSCSDSREHRSSSSGLEALSGLQQLQHLDLSSCCLTDVSPLVHLGCLTCLKLGYSGFWQHHYNQLLPESFAALGKLTGLRHLDLHYCMGYDTCFPTEASCLSALSQLTHLDISGCWSACWHIMKPPSKLPALRQLLMLLQNHAALSSIAAACSGLEALHMSDGGQQMPPWHCNLRDVAVLQGLACLTSLSIASLEALQCVHGVAQLHGLRHLKLYSSQGLSDVQALELSALQQLTCLDLRHSGVSDAAVGRLVRALPDTWVRSE